MLCSPPPSRSGLAGEKHARRDILTEIAGETEAISIEVGYVRQDPADNADRDVV
jgi:hypothetical protein